MLKKNSRIKSIEKEKVRQILLQDSVPLINATPTFNLQVNGLNLTGAGQSVCIIDTGINYSHIDLGGCWGNNSNVSKCKVWGGQDFCSDNGVLCSGVDDIPEDAHGHGTHVSGIVSANGSMKGVAPDSRLIIIKACNSTGSCFDADIIAGLQWCTNNASLFNISAISMSIGGGLYSSYCNDDTLAEYINNAVARNISVVIATGNDYSTTKISSPACVQNATPVGSTTKADAISSFSNRNSILQLMAPGGISTSSATKINSTWYDGGYYLTQGTSMATPHVAGAIAIMNQYLRLMNRTKTPAEIESVLNSTGKQIVDTSGNGLTYSRIRVYEAIIEVDEESPNSTLSYPANATNSVNRNYTFACNGSDLALKNATLIVWNSTGQIYARSEANISGANYSYLSNVSNMVSGNYKWNCEFIDEGGNRAVANANYTLIITNVSVVLSSPAGNLKTKINHTFTCNSSTSSNNLTNITFYIWNSTSDIQSQQNKTISGISNSSMFGYNFTRIGEYYWNCLAYNGENMSAVSEQNRTITYDLTPPNISVNSPLNNSWVNIGLFNVSLTENGSCKYSINNGANITMTTNDERVFVYTNSILINGTYNLSYYCNDSAGNDATPYNMIFKVDTSMPNITTISPANGYSVTGAVSMTFIFNATDNLNITGCKLVLNSINAANNSSAVMQNETNQIVRSVGEGTHIWQINCTDEAGNEGNSSLNTLIVNSASSSSSSSSSGGGGGGGSTTTTGTTYSPTQSQLKEGYRKSLNEGDKIKVVFLDLSGRAKETHTIEVNETESNWIRLIIRSEPITKILEIGQEIKLSISSSNSYDLWIKLNSIINGKADISVRTINEPIGNESSNIKENADKEKNNSASLNKSTNIGNSVSSVLIKLLSVLLIAAIITAYMRNRQKRTLHYVKKQAEHHGH
jgi:subtilisin family serine protease